MSYRLYYNGCPLRRLPLAKISARRRRGVLKARPQGRFREDLECFGVAALFST